MNDPEVVRAADNFVRVIVRRPHAYLFIGNLFEDRGGIKSATPGGCTLADGSTAPLPGIYVLDSDGAFEASSEVSKAGLLKLLGEPAPREPGG